MNPSTETIFLQAVELPKPARPGFLDDACRGDVKLRAAVDALLWADEHPDILTRSPVSPTLASAVASAAESIDVGHGLEGPGSVIGLYTLREELGEGGFGRVFLAEQEHPVRRRVALKILKAGMDTRQVIGRFEAERQALAMMDHPGIAKVFDAGTTSSGRPYFVMELVRGIPLTAYADQHHLTLRDRLELFREVCLAVQHAHSKGIIHRDIKPSNLLVVAGDDRPEPKVIDFGIAKATGAQLSDKTVHTQAAQWLGTPEYMSPEQAAGGQDIDTRGDIYSLGATLYELLVGVTPFDTLRMRSISYDQVARMIREDDPPPPSTRLSRLGDGAVSLAGARKTDVSRLAGALRGDLDWIVMRAIDKDRSRRYETAAALAADIQRFLDDKPVEARPPTASYQITKWVRRNRGAFAASCAVGAAIVLGIIGLGVGLVRAADEARRAERSAGQARESATLATEARAEAEREAHAARVAEAEAREAQEIAQTAEAEALAAAQRERDAASRAQRALEVAELQRRRAEAVERFVQHDMLGTGDSDEPLSPGFTVHQMVENAERRLDAGTQGIRPEFEGAIRHLIGLLFLRVGDYQKAERSLRQGLDLVESLPTPPDPSDHADAIDALGVVLNYLGRLPESQRMHERALEIRQRLHADAPESAEALKDLSTSYSNLGGVAADMADWDRAEQLYRRSLEVRPDSEYTANNLINLGMVLAQKGDFTEGERLIRQGIADATDSRGRSTSLVGSGLALLGEMFLDARRPADAIEPLRESIEIRTEVFGPTHRFTIASRTQLGRALLATDPEAGLAEITAAAQTAHDTLPVEDVYRLNAEQRLAMTLYSQARYDLAEPWMRAFDPVMRYHFEPDDRALGGFLDAFGETLVRLGGAERLAEAEAILRECLALRERAYEATDRSHWLIEETRERLGGALLELARLEPDEGRAIPLFEEAEGLLLEAQRAMDPPTQREARLSRCLKRLIDLYEAWDAIAPDRGLAERAAPWRERLAEIEPPSP